MPCDYRQLLVHLDGTARAPARQRYAQQLAQAHGAALHALYAVQPAFVDMPYPGGIASSYAVQLQALDAERKQRARAEFDRCCAQTDIAPTWGEIESMFLTGEVARQAMYSDLIVLGQPDPGDALSRSVPPDFLAEVVLGSGRPALVLPYAGSFEPRLERIVLAWKDSTESARALAAALPLLVRAAHVDVLRWGVASGTAASNAFGLQTYLQRHGVPAVMHDAQEEPAELGELLLSRASDFDADLLVMGCYGHTRAREWLLGGVSRTVLQSMTLPVLMAH